MSVLATGILLGPGGETLLTDGGLPAFFEQVRTWYGHDAQLIGSNAPPPAEDFDLSTSRRTHFEAFEVFVPFGEVRLDIPPGAPITPVSFASFLQGAAAGQGSLATLVGPYGFGAEQYIPADATLPYTVYFEHDAAASRYANEVRIVLPLDDDLDPRRFRLGDMSIGPITVDLPESRGAFQGEFDFTESKGFILRVNAGLEPVAPGGGGTTARRHHSPGGQSQVCDVLGHLVRQGQGQDAEFFDQVLLRVGHTGKAGLVILSADDPHVLLETGIAPHDAEPAPGDAAGRAGD